MRPALLTLVLYLTACDFDTASRPEAAFTPAPITWQEVAAAPLARFEGQSAVAGGKLYVFGGYTDGSILPKSFEAHVYDPSADTWARLPDMPRPLTHAGTATDGKNIYLAGGVVGSDDADDTDRTKIPATTEVWRFDTTTDEWSALPPLPEPRGAGALVVVGGSLHYFGGTGLDRYQEVGEHWSLPLDGSAPRNRQWRALATLPNPRNHLAGIVVDGSIYAIGGQHGHNETLVTQASVERYDAANDRWVERTSLPYGLGHISSSAMTIGGRIYIVGGETGGFGDYTDTVQVYDPELDAWSTTTPYPRPENSLIGGAVGKDIFITGGSERSLKTVKGILRD